MSLEGISMILQWITIAAIFYLGWHLQNITKELQELKKLQEKDDQATPPAV